MKFIKNLTILFNIFLFSNTGITYTKNLPINKDIALWGGSYTFTTRNGIKYSIQKKYTYCNKESIELEEVGIKLGVRAPGSINNGNKVTYRYETNCTFNGTVKYLNGYRETFKKVINCDDYKGEFCNAAKKFGLIN